MLRPELIVPPIIEKLFASIDNTNEPHRFTSIMTCLTRITRQLVRQTPCYSQGQTYVLPLIMSVLPGIDLNDFKKTSITLEFLNTIFMLITCVDCSSAIHIRKDLTDIEKEVCLSTAKFGDFINEFLDRIFRMIKILSTDMSDAAVIIDEANMEDTTLESKLRSIMANIVQQCSSKIFQIIREKITDFVTHSYWSAKVRKIVASLVQAIVLGDPVETLKYLLPKTCDSINKIMNDAEGHGLLTDHKGDKELTWYLFLFSELVRARGDTLIIYRQMIISVFHRCIQIIHKGSYKAVASAAKHLLKSLTHIYMINTRWTGENIDGPYVDFLPIRVWGQPVDVDKFQVQFHIPGDDELDFAREFVETYVPVPSSCIHTCVDLLVHDHIELRKYAIQSIAAICRLQKSPRIYVEKSLDGILHETKKESSSVTMHDECHPGDRDDNLWVTMDCYKPPETQAEWEQTCFLDKTFHGYYTWPKMIKYSMNKRARYTQNDMPEQVAIIYNRFMDKNFLIQSTKLMISDEHTDEINFDYVRVTMFKEHEDPRRMYRLIDFMRTLINNRISSNTFNEISRWSLIQTLRMFQWRIPSIWCTIHEYARELLDHSFKPVREHIANVLSMSFSFNIRLFNGKSTRHPSINQCMDVIYERLHQAIEIYEKTPLGRT
ncbi:unnamed protein product [Rotaria sordida]|uniref:Proteasome activator Blm10 mid region domain-containing protein n=1 Tax=Rotaria sordida TaxID=392033 RepID=A0A813VS45_9BILA|nr:unnamed protein product [Rotaria sordida]CAF0841729.1 unnamed protein product [Rotaria sordida]